MKSRSFCIVFITIIMIYFLPAILAGENHYLEIHDFLDSTVAHIKSMVDNNILFDKSGVIPILGGVPRSWYLSPIDLKVLLFTIMSPYWAVIANIFLIKITAFFGMFFLLRCYILRNSDVRASFITALLFSLVPFYPDYGISSAGVPLVAFCFLNLHERRSPVLSFACLIYYSLFSWLALSGVFVCFCYAVAILFCTVRERRFPIWAFVGLCIVTLAYISANFEMIHSSLTNDVPTHREEFSTAMTLPQVIGETVATLLVSQYHAGICAAFLLVGSFVFFWRKHRTEDKSWDILFGSFIILASLILFSSLIKVLPQGCSLFRTFQFDRFYFLYPAVCFAMFGAVVPVLLRENRKKALVIISSLILVTGLSTDRFITGDICRLIGIDGYPGFKSFYDEELFGRIKSDLDINDRTAEVACLGLYPSVAEYNGIVTVDGYIQQYPLEYKHLFYKVICKELDKDGDLKDYFCDWGSRCYLFSSELGNNFIFGKKAGKAVSNLELDIEALRSLGCSFILSAVDVENYRDLGLEPAGVWEGGFWKIRAYRLKTMNGESTI